MKTHPDGASSSSSLAGGGDVGRSRRGRGGAGKVWRIGVLGGAPLPVLSQTYSASSRHARTRLYRGEGLVSELRTADSSYERLPGLATELVRIGADVLLAGAGPAVLALKGHAHDPHRHGRYSRPGRFGFIVSLARPGGKHDRRGVQHCRKRRRSNWAAGGHRIQSIPDRSARESGEAKPCAGPQVCPRGRPAGAAAVGSRLKRMRRRLRRPSPHSAAKRCRRSWWLPMRSFPDAAVPD